MNGYAIDTNIIAASCIAHNYTLVPNNTRHFEKIAELKIEDWATE